VACALASGAHAADQPWASVADPSPQDRAQVQAYAQGKGAVAVPFKTPGRDESPWRPVVDDNPSVLSCRQAGNIRVSGAILSLATDNSVGCKAKWSTGYVQTAANFGYGYYEASIKFGNTNGLNNAFWLNAEEDAGRVQFEIDIVEGHYPNIAGFGLHDWRGAPRAKGKFVNVAGDAINQFHRYGALVLPDRVVYAIDGQPVATIQTQVYGKIRIRLSTAIMTWAGKLDRDPVGASMQIKDVAYHPLAQ